MEPMGNEDFIKNSLKTKPGFGVWVTDLELRVSILDVFKVRRSEVHVLLHSKFRDTLVP